MPATDSDELHSAQDNRDDWLWLVRSAEHVNVNRKLPEEYIARVAGFFRHHLV